MALAAVLLASMVASIGAALGASSSASSPGSLLAWGEGGSGQIGNGQEANEASPVGVVAGYMPIGARITQASSGFHDSVVLTSGGGIYTWGAGEDGELGDGSSASSPLPVRVSSGEIPARELVVAVAAGAHTDYALTKEGAVYAWGDGAEGALGDGSTNSSQTPVKVAVPEGVTVVAIAAGEDGAMALSSAGEVLTWGAGASGQLGDGATQFSLVPVRAALPAGTAAVQIAAERDTDLAVSSNGGAYAWGDGELGQLGNGSRASVDYPVEVKLGEIPAGSQFVQLAGGASSGYALASNGRMYAWGSNLSGELGDGATSEAVTEPVAVETGAMPAGESVIEISAASEAGYGLTSKGQVYAWGAADEGDLGDGSSSEAEYQPVAVDIPQGESIDTLAGGSDANHLFAIIGDLSISSTSLPTGTVSDLYTGELARQGGVAPYTWSASGLPPGLTLNKLTGFVSGYPQASGSFEVTVGVTDADGLTSTSAVALSIQPPATSGQHTTSTTVTKTITRSVPSRETALSLRILSIKVLRDRDLQVTLVASAAGKLRVVGATRTRKRGTHSSRFGPSRRLRAVAGKHEHVTLAASSRFIKLLAARHVVSVRVTATLFPSSGARSKTATGTVALHGKRRRQ